MFRLENASPPLKMCIFPWCWRVNPLNIFTFYSNVLTWRNGTSDMPCALWSSPSLLGPSTSRPSLFTVLLGFVPCFCSLLNERPKEFQ
jgi:hypothetical protein